MAGRCGERALNPRTFPPADYLEECFLYDECSGKLFWKRRPRKHFVNENAFAVWNSRFAGKEALYVDAHGYGIVRLDGVNRKVHRVIWKLKTGEEPPVTIDHADRNKTNNRWKNIRAATYSQNNMNKALPLPRSGHHGVYRQNGRWSAGISTPKGPVSIGVFTTKEEAVRARKAKVAELYGEFAK
jgi:hypothetical protein